MPRLPHGAVPAVERARQRSPFREPRCAAWLPPLQLLAAVPVSTVRLATTGDLVGGARGGEGGPALAEPGAALGHCVAATRSGGPGMVPHGDGGLWRGACNSACCVHHAVGSRKAVGHGVVACSVSGAGSEQRPYRRRRRVKVRAASAARGAAMAATYRWMRRAARRLRRRPRRMQRSRRRWKVGCGERARARAAVPWRALRATADRVPAVPCWAMPGRAVMCCADVAGVLCPSAELDAQHDEELAAQAEAEAAAQAQQEAAEANGGSAGRCWRAVVARAAPAVHRCLAAQ
jgi:hypothetical protein